MIITKAHSSINVTISWESFQHLHFFWILEPCFHPLVHSGECARLAHACCWIGAIAMGRLASCLQHYCFPSKHSGEKSYVHCFWYESIKGKRKLYLCMQYTSCYTLIPAHILGSVAPLVVQNAQCVNTGRDSAFPEFMRNELSNCLLNSGFIYCIKSVNVLAWWQEVCGRSTHCGADGGEESSGRAYCHPVSPPGLFMPHWGFFCKLEGLYIFYGDLGGLNLPGDSTWLLLPLVHPSESWHWDETQMTQRSISW